jgi:hypothetical protein
MMNEFDVTKRSESMSEYACLGFAIYFEGLQINQQTRSFAQQT